MMDNLSFVCFTGKDLMKIHIFLLFVSIVKIHKTVDKSIVKDLFTSLKL